MEFRKPSKAKRNEEFLRSLGMLDESPYMDAQLEQKKKFLIVCEGENTERYYFEAFPVPSKSVEVIGGCGSKMTLVDYALELRDSGAYEGYEIWCVFDFDVKPDEHATQPAAFNNSIRKAEESGLKVAWSNDAFEFWFLLHFAYVDNALSRNEINPILKGHWNLDSFHKEAKRVEFCTKLYDLHSGSQAHAINHARKLHQRYGANTDYARQCPCTTVYLLVEELNKNIRP